MNIKQQLEENLLILQLNIITENTTQHIQMTEENADLKKENGHPKIVSLTLKLISKKSIYPVEKVFNRMLKRFKKNSKPCVLNPKY